MSSPVDAVESPTSPFGPPGDDPIYVVPSALNAIDNHLAEITSLRQPMADDTTQGSVMAVVTFPKDNGSAMACDGRPWEDVRIRMSFDKLLRLGSKKIANMLTPRAQARFRRRLGHEQQEQLPPGIEYVIDFTPPSEGPELADLTAALWLPRMVKIWFLAGHYVPDRVLESGIGIPTRPLADKGVGAMLVLGHDDVCKASSCLTDFAEWHTKEKVSGITEDSSHIPAWRNVEDYCPIRHRVAIIRVLRAINGDSLLLNSAVRLWTVAQVAVSLDVPQVVRDTVAQWLVAAPNTKFIELCPEKAFQLAYALKIPSVLIAAFRILVNELAIDYASSKPLPGRPSMTWNQRRRDDYGDYPSDPVEYASRAFAERMNNQLSILQSDEAFNRLPQRIPEWEKLQYLGTLIASLEPGPLSHAYKALTEGLLTAFREWIVNALDVQHLSARVHDLITAQRKHYLTDTDSPPLFSIYKQLNPSQKVLTPFFWDRFLLTDPVGNFAATRIGSKRLSTLESDFNLALRQALSPTAPATTTFKTAIFPLPPKIKLDLNHPVFTHSLAHTFHLSTFHLELTAAVKQLCSTTLRHIRDVDGGSGGIPYFLSDHLLLALNEHELNYLPIWADGLDDGSGGVFQDAIPEAEMGPSEPGPGYHTGYTVAGARTEDDFATVGGGEGTLYAVSTVGGVSDLGMGRLVLGSEAGIDVGGGGKGKAVEGTVGGRSLAVQRSAQATTSEARTGWSSSLVGGGSAATPSEGFTAGDTDEEGMYADARFAQPAAHQAQGQAIERYVHEADEGSSASGSMVQGGFGEDGGDGMDLDGDGDEGYGGEMEWDESDEDDGSSTLDGFEEVDADEAV